MNNKLLEILVCPVCKGPLTYRKEAAELVCQACRIAYPIRDDIPVMLPEEARPLETHETYRYAMQFRVVIPARYASSRLPGKPLADIGGRPMVLRVLDRALQAGAQEVVVATDDVRVQQAVEAAGQHALLTSPEHASGTERLVEVVETLGWNDDTLVVNVQGDEPLIDPALIHEAARQLVLHDDAVMATLAHPIHDHADFVNPNVVKVVADEAGYAVYFSRAPIPWPRDAFAAGESLPDTLGALRHIGLYAYRAGFLRTYSGLAVSPLEQVEMLEQLRVLWHGYRISLGIAAGAPAAGVDTPEDLARVRALFADAKVS